MILSFSRIGPPVDPQHSRHVRAVDVAVQQPHLRSELTQRHRQVHRHRGLAHPALAARHRQRVLHAGQHLAFMTEARVGRDFRRPGDLHRARPAQPGNRLSYLALYGFSMRRGRRRQHHRQRHVVAVYPHVANQARRHQAALQVRFHHARQRLSDLGGPIRGQLGIGNHGESRGTAPHALGACTVPKASTVLSVIPAKSGTHPRRPAPHLQSHLMRQSTKPASASPPH